MANGRKKEQVGTVLVLYATWICTTSFFAYGWDIFLHDIFLISNRPHCVLSHRISKSQGSSSELSHGLRTEWHPPWETQCINLCLPICPVKKGFCRGDPVDSYQRQILAIYSSRAVGIIKQMGKAHWKHCHKVLYLILSWCLISLY